jgi:predicted enzyme related to lactoylglutathione lyase
MADVWVDNGEELAMANSDPVPFGVTVSTDNLEDAREFYTKMYPDHETMTEGIFGTIKYFSLIGKDGEVLVNVLQKQADNPIQGAIPMLKVDSVSDWIAKFGAMGGKVVIPQVVCPCTQTYFAVVTDSQGNQMLLKEPKDHKISSLIRCYWWAERISAQPFLTTITVGALGGYRSRQSCPHRSS